MANPRHAISSRVHPNIRGATLEILERFPDIPQIWTWADFPDHNNGRCTDFMSYSDRALGDRIVRYVLEHADRLGLIYIVWWRRIYRHRGNANGPARTWTAYHGPNPHTDHVHIEVAAQPYRPPAVIAPAPQTGELTVAQIDDLRNDIGKLASLIRELPREVWSADVIPNVWTSDRATNKSVAASNALRFTGADVNALQDQFGKLEQRISALEGRATPGDANSV